MGDSLAHDDGLVLVNLDDADVPDAQKPKRDKLKLIIAIIAAAIAAAAGAGI